MKKRLRAECLLAGLALGLWCGHGRPSLAAATAPQDQAVVVGIDRYPVLPDAANRLKGCASDARAVATTLRAQGFNVSLLTDDQASRGKINAALAQARAALGSGGRFAFYFAGHGTMYDGRRALVPADMGRGASDHVLLFDDLIRAVGDMPSRSRTIFLDTCFSPGLGVMSGRTPRFYSLAASGADTAGTGAKGLNFGPASHQEDASPAAMPNAQAWPGVICCLAAIGNEAAYEIEDAGGQHGVFTDCLVSELRSLTAHPGTRWQEFQRALKQKVAEALQDRQHPLLLPGDASDAVVLSAAVEAVSPPSTTAPGATTLWDTYTTDKADESRLSLAISPDRSTLALNQPFTISAQAGIDGYLILLERFGDNQVYRLYPRSTQVDEAHVTAGQTIIRRFIGDEPGQEYVRALLFTSRAQADAVLANLPGDAGQGIPLAGMRRLREAPAEAAAFFTAQLSFSVSGGEMARASAVAKP